MPLVIRSAERRLAAIEGVTEILRVPLPTRLQPVHVRVTVAEPHVFCGILDALNASPLTMSWHTTEQRGRATHER